MSKGCVGCLSEGLLVLLVGAVMALVLAVFENASKPLVVLGGLAAYLLGEFLYNAGAREPAYPDPEDSLLRQTNQRWKVTVLGLGVAVSGLLFLFAVVTTFRPWLSIAFGVATVGTLALSVRWATRSIACPQCDYSLFWHDVSNHRPWRWLVWLLSVRACPACHRLEPPALEPS